MKRLITIVSAAAAVAALTVATPALAKSKKHKYRHQGYEQSYQYGPQYGWLGGWNSRSVSGSDPSFGNRGAINRAYSTGRCVEDLGYGRYEYCGW
jgi:hypothetical protein